MITEQDITMLKAVFVTKEEFNAFDLKVDGIQETVGDLKVEMGEMNDKMDTMLIKMDNFTGSVRTLEQENGAGAAHLARHDRQIEVLAASTGITLPN